MHSCLHIEEILQKIAENVEDKKSLAHMALTCRAFYEPALNFCWETLHEFTPLLRCLPADVIDVEDRELHHPDPNYADVVLVELWSLNRQLTLVECARFFHHSVRVRTLVTEGCPKDLQDMPTKFDHTCYTILLASLQGAVAFPNLRSLCHRVSADPSDPLALFLGPSLREVTYEYDTDAEDQNYLADRSIGALCKAVPALECIHMGTGVAGTEAISALSSLPSLHTLGIRLDDSNDLSGALSRIVPTAAPSFASLRTLVLHAPADTAPRRTGTLIPIQNGIAFLNSLSAAGCQLHELVVDLICQTSEATIYALCTAMAAFAPTLKSCSFHVPPGLHVASDPLNIHLLSPLLQIPCLRAFNPWAAHFETTDADFARMAQAWPHLTQLTLGDQTWHTPSHTTLDGLAAIAAGWPALDALMLKVSDAADTAALRVAAPHTALTTLTLGGGHVTRDFEAGAAFVGRLFPNAVVCFLHRDYKVMQAWEQSLLAAQRAERERLGIAEDP
ncbi:hypothetical protein PsYK624_167930 [Phanerochaete sordida]|uniref:F-box domain-containing protein n=1 Tax=Phanerochaete sordida TaxID=48140 RepID=A0A9P3GRH4_9APHY|nr:hypothetical protein PsYK624_167930 [Phanerochaete sordida]